MIEDRCVNMPSVALQTILKEKEIDKVKKILGIKNILKHLIKTLDLFG